MNLAAQRAVNAKAYWYSNRASTQAVSRYQGTGKDHVADICWVPAGRDPPVLPYCRAQP